MWLAVKLARINDIYFQTSGMPWIIKKKYRSIHEIMIMFLSDATRVRFVHSLTYYLVQRGTCPFSCVLEIWITHCHWQNPTFTQTEYRQAVSLSNSSRQNFGLLVNFVFLKNEMRRLYISIVMEFCRKQMFIYKKGKDNIHILPFMKAYTCILLQLIEYW